MGEILARNTFVSYTGSILELLKLHTKDKFNVVSLFEELMRALNMKINVPYGDLKAVQKIDSVQVELFNQEQVDGHPRTLTKVPVALYLIANPDFWEHATMVKKLNFTLNKMFVAYSKPRLPQRLTLLKRLKLKEFKILISDYQTIIESGTIKPSYMFDTTDYLETLERISEIVMFEVKTLDEFRKDSRNSFEEDFQEEKISNPKQSSNLRFVSSFLNDEFLKGYVATIPYSLNKGGINYEEYTKYKAAKIVVSTVIGNKENIRIN